MHQTKKGNQYYFGEKLHIGVHYLRTNPQGQYNRREPLQIHADYVAAVVFSLVFAVNDIRYISR